MGDGLLVCLRSYRARPDRDSLEDFVTEAFCWLMRTSEALTNALLEQINAKLGETGSFSLPEDQPNWETQVTLGSNRIDMMASWDGMRVLFEHKVNAMLHDGQLSSYEAAAQEYFPQDDHRLILITANRAQHDRGADVCLCWKEIFQLVSSLVETVDVEPEQAYLQEFLHLLRHEGLAPPAPIDHQALRYFPIARALPTQLENVLAPMQHRSWPVPKSYKCSFKKHWGRIGLEFCLSDQGRTKEWLPGLFLGCVLDGADHKIAHRHPDALQMQLIVDFNRYLHSLYPDMASYIGLKDALAKATSAASNPWQFYDHLSEPKAVNKYHALYLERPLLEVFRGSRTSEEQQDRFYTLGCEALQLMRDAGLAALMDECGRIGS